MDQGVKSTYGVQLRRMVTVRENEELAPSSCTAKSKYINLSICRIVATRHPKIIFQLMCSEAHDFTKRAADLAFSGRESTDQEESMLMTLFKSHPQWVMRIIANALDASDDESLAASIASFMIHGIDKADPKMLAPLSTLLATSLASSVSQSMKTIKQSETPSMCRSMSSLTVKVDSTLSEQQGLQQRCKNPGMDPQLFQVITATLDFFLQNCNGAETEKLAEEIVDAAPAVITRVIGIEVRKYYEQNP